MPERANSFPRMIPSVVFVLLAMFAVNFESPVRADSACIEQPGQQVGGTHWVLHYDPAKGRECWILVDMFGRETGLWGGPATMPQAQPSAAPAPTLSSPHESLPGNFNVLGGSANVTPERSAPQISHPNPAHKPQGNVANANNADNGVRADQKSNDRGHAVKRVSPVLIDREESAQFEKFLRWRERQQQFEEFLRWRERQQLTGAMKPEHAETRVSPVLIDREESAQFEELRRREIQQLIGAMKPEHAETRVSPVLIDREESAQFEEFLRWRERQQLTGAMKPGPSSQ